MKTNKKLMLLAVFSMLALSSCGEKKNSVPPSQEPPSVQPSLPGTSDPTPSLPGSQTPAVDVAVSISGPNEVEAGQSITLNATVTGATNTAVTWSITGDVATVVDGVVTANAVVDADTTVTVKATSVEDTTKFAEHVVLVKATPVDDSKLEAEIVISDFNVLDDVKTSIVEGTGAYMLKVDITSLPNGKSLDDVEITWPGNTGLVTYLPAPADRNLDKTYSQFITNFAGTINVEVKVSCGDETISVKKDFEVSKNPALYTQIGTADEFKNMLENPVAGQRYELTSNIDLNGAIVNGRGNETTFTGLIDGNGYSVTNFVVKNESNNEPDVATGLFWIFNGVIRNTHLKGTIDAGGFSGLLAKELNGLGLVENCLFEANNVRAAADWTWGRNGVIVSTVNGTPIIRNSITNLDAVDAMCFPFVAYTWNGTQKFEHLYTNVARDYTNPNYWPFQPEGAALPDQSLTINDVVHTPFDSTPASTYNLDASIWTLVDNQMPVLAHYGEAPSVDTPVPTNKYGTVDQPISVAEALAIAEDECKVSGDISAEILYVTGTVSDQPDNSGSYIKTFYLKDLVDSSKTVMVYSCNKTTGVDDPDQNDTIVMSGYIKMYGSTIEFADKDKTIYPTMISNTRGTSSVTVGNSNGANVTLDAESGLNGSSFTFSVTAESGKNINLVKVNGSIVNEVEGKYTGIIHGDTVVTVDTSDVGAVEPTLAASLSFATKDTRVSQDSNSQVWANNGITFTNDKAKSTNNVADYANPVRIYANSTVTIAYTSEMVKIVIHVNNYSDAYVTAVVNAVNAVDGLSAVADGYDVTITFEAATSITFTPTAQVRFNSLDVYTL